MKKSKTKKIEKIIKNYLFKYNDEPTRSKLVIELNNATKFLLVDKTTPELVMDNFVKLEGLDPETNKIISITIQPTYYQFDINGNLTRY
jgi:hypothetical protein